MSLKRRARLWTGLAYVVAWLVVLSYTLGELIYEPGGLGGLLQREPTDRALLLCAATLCVLLLALGIYNITLYLRQERR